MAKFLRASMIAGLCVTTFGLSACFTVESSDDDSSTGSESDTDDLDNADDEVAAELAALEGDWAFYPNNDPDSERGPVIGFNLDDEGTVEEYWMEGRLGDLDADLVVSDEGDMTLEWTLEPGESGGDHDSGFYELAMHESGEYIEAVNQNDNEQHFYPWEYSFDD